MIWGLITVAVLSAALMSAPVRETREPPPDEVRIGEVAEPDNIQDINAAAGWYRKTKYGWVFSADSELGPARPPDEQYAAFLDERKAESVGGLAVIAVLGALVIGVKFRGKKSGGVPKDGVSRTEFQTLARRLNGMADILESVTEAESVKTAEKGGKKR